MLTFRKAVIVAVCLITFIVLLSTSHSTSQPQSVASTSGNEETVQSPPQQAQKKSAVQQQTLESIADKPLREKLRYHFPYDLKSKFPAYIWQTWKYTPSSGWFGETLRPMEASWTEMHPGFVHEVVADDTAVHLIKYLYAGVPEVTEAYASLPVAVLKADFFRYLILLARGGIYSDIDTIALKPASEWLPEKLDRSTVGLVVGIEADPDRPDWHEWYSRRIQFCQWTIQAKRGHPVLRDIVATITEETLRMKKAGILTKSKMDKTIVEFTGPAVWTDAVFSYFNNPDYFKSETGSPKNVTAADFTGITTHKKVGDVVVLPITSFSPGVRQMGAGEIDDPLAFVKHEFEGTWKPESERHASGGSIE
ncbi:CAZyme family GT32 [Paecilomyces variotii]|nr:CAZyme family GT32 [Paecilomyces variotii]